MITSTATSHPFALAIAGDSLLWTDWVSRGVFRCHKLGGAVTPLRRDTPRPMGIVAVRPQKFDCQYHGNSKLQVTHKLLIPVEEIRVVFIFKVICGCTKRKLP